RGSEYRDEQNDRAGNQDAMSAPGTAPPLVEDVRIHACRDGKRPPRRVNSTTTVASGLVVPMRTILPRNASAAISPRSEGPKLKGLEPPNPDDRARDQAAPIPGHQRVSAVASFWKGPLGTIREFTGPIVSRPR